MRQQKSSFDLVILGSGSAAFAAAIKGAQLGARVAMTESRIVGGTCVNRGCIPSKYLIEAAGLYHAAARPRFPGLRLEAKGVDFAELVGQKDALVGELRQAKYLDIAAEEPNIDLIEGHARLISPQATEVNGRTLQAERFIIATGARAAIPPIPGLDSVPYLTSELLSDEAGLRLEELPSSLVVIGGGFIALELGQMFARLGTEVTILEMAPTLLPSSEPEVSQALRYYLEEEGLKIFTSSRVQQVEANGGVRVWAEVEGEQHTFSAQKLLVATGLRPNSDQIGLEAAGVEVNGRGFIQVDDEMRTSVPHIWAVGDVTGPPMATPAAAREGVIAAENAVAGRHRRVDSSAIPRAMFTDPQVASVGFTDEEAGANGYTCTCRTLPMTFVPKAHAMGDTRGLIKMVAEARTGRVMGVHIVAPLAADIIHEAALAVKHRLTIYDLEEAIHVYPTMSEAIKMVAQTFTKDVSKLSCCAE